MTVLEELEIGTRRAAWPDPASAGGWRVDAAVKEAILACFADRTTATWEAGPLAFRDRIGVPPRDWSAAADGAAVRGWAAVWKRASLEFGAARRNASWPGGRQAKPRTLGSRDCRSC